MTDTDEESAPTGVRSLLRGLEILIAVNENPPATITRLVTLTGLPKATVIRLLATLKSAGYLQQNSDTGAYEPLPQVRRLASAMMIENPFLTEARQRLNAFGLQVGWPSDLLMAEPDAMVTAASNRDTAPIHLRRFEQRRFPILDSAAGLAFLAALPQEERLEIVNRHCAMMDEGGDVRQTVDATLRAVAEVGRHGFSMHDYNAPMAGTRAVGVAVVSQDRPVGALVLIILKGAVTDGQLHQQYLPALQDCAAGLGDAYHLHRGAQMPFPDA
ncbi:helix-turn-helix domain-containing protein [Nitratireductor pacificus]|uniref:DNA-binding transcriptional activator MhpR n=1 Tax=Nitratireductor pacificus pht-3B TaxID=391937 RepID=K2LSW9_9HYPH|nr:helix-turn-helix domain-containing protein [Nitratireductor pacificus]EKF20874.1 DNA-binding transcriptional activator MhpR [Nitratireductor pacificus pht-3B]